jgi:hypothetical protein
MTASVARGAQRPPCHNLNISQSKLPPLIILPMTNGGQDMQYTNSGEVLVTANTLPQPRPN